MDNLRPIQAAEEAAGEIQEAVRGKLVSWLDHHSCKSCGSVCEADTQFVESQAAILPIYECPQCGKRYFREEDTSKLTAEMWNR